jgi:O-antigen/teichoic acid export membrane protein
MQIVCAISKYTVFLMLLPALPILLETQFLLNLWLGEVPEYTSIFCWLIILNALVNCLSGSISTAVQATGDIKYFQIVVNTMSLLSLPIAFILFKLGCPPYSILIAFIVTGLINVVTSQILLKRLIHFDVKAFLRFFHLRVFYVILAVSPLFVVKNFYPDGIARFVAMSVVSVVWCLAAIYVVGIEKVERDILSYRIGKLYARFC